MEILQKTQRKTHLTDLDAAITRRGQLAAQTYLAAKKAEKQERFDNYFFYGMAVLILVMYLAIEAVL